MGAGARSRHAGVASRARWRTDLALWALVLIWGANFAVVKAALAEFRPLAFNAVRFALASALLYLLGRLFKRRCRFDRRDWPALVGLGILGNTAYQVLFIYGIDWTLAGNAALMLATVPVLVALGSALLGHERLGPVASAGVALSFAGIPLVVWGGARAVRFGADTVRGDLTMLAAAVAWSAYTVGSRDLVRRHGAFPVTATTLWIGAAGLLLVSLPSLASQDWQRVGPAAWGGLLYSGALSIAVAYLLWYSSIGRIGGSRTAVYSNTIPLVALLFAWMWLGEVPSLLQGAGAAVLLAGVMLARLAGSVPPAEK